MTRKSLKLFKNEILLVPVACQFSVHRLRLAQRVRGIDQMAVGERAVEEDGLSITTRIKWGRKTKVCP